MITKWLEINQKVYRLDIHLKEDEQIFVGTVWDHSGSSAVVSGRFISEVISRSTELIREHEKVVRKV